MTENDVRNWLGKYFLYITVFIGGYILLFAETMALPGLSRDQAWKVFQIIIPVLVGQLTIIFRWFGNREDRNKSAPEILSIPEWIIKGPPLLTSGLIVLMVLMMIIGNNQSKPWGPTADTVSLVITFVVTIINATTLFVVAGYFTNSQEKVAADGVAIQQGKRPPI